jgi:hypothetical protein
MRWWSKDEAGTDLWRPELALLVNVVKVSEDTDDV